MIMTILNNRFIKDFDQSDSIYIFKIPDKAETLKFGYALNEDTDLIIV